MPDPTTLAMSRTVTRGMQTRSTPPWAADPAPQGRQGSVFVTGQECSREQRRGRYTPESIDHPGKMLPSIARYLIATYTQAGEPVADPMAGINTTVVEAMHLGRHGIGIEYEPKWAWLAADNIRLATAHGATGTGEIYQGDSRHLPALIPPELHGRIALVITSPPYGPSTHGHARTPGPRRGKVRKIRHRYGDGGQGPLMSAPHDRPPGDRPGRSNRATPQGRVRHHRRGRRRGQAPGRASGQGHPRSPDLVARIQQRPRQPHPTERSPSRLTSGNPTPAMRLTA
jgi:hypothetical protein